MQTLQNSLDNLQRYQRDAKDVKDLLDFEEKITARQAELQSLEAQQAYLADQTSMSTITLHLSTPGQVRPAAGRARGRRLPGRAEGRLARARRRRRSSR